MRRLVLITAAAAAASILATLGILPAAHAETTAPVLDGIERLSPDTIQAGQDVVVRVRAHDSGGSHFAHARTTFEGPLGVRIEVDASSGADDVVDLTAATPTGRWIAPGRYQALSVHLDDWAGNERTFDQNSLDWRSRLALLDFTITNTRPDVTAPTLSNLALSGSTVSAGDTLALTYTAYDADSGIEAVEAYLVADEGEGREQRGILLRSPADPELAAVGPAAGQVPLAAVGGSYHVWSVAVRDRAGNMTTYLPTWVAVSPPGLGRPTPLDLVPAGIIVDQPATGDDTPPLLRAVRMLTPPVLHPSEPAVFTYEASDIGSAVAAVYLMAADDEGHTLMAMQRCGDFRNGRNSLYPGTGVGSWRVTEVVVVDAIGNRTTYSRTAPPVTSTGVSVPPVDLSGLRFGYAPGASREGPAPYFECPVPEVTATPDAAYVTPGTTVVVTGRVSLVGQDGGPAAVDRVASDVTRRAVRSPLVAIYGKTAGRTALLGLKRGTTQGTFSRSVKVDRTTSFRVWFPGDAQVAGDSAGALSATATVKVGHARSLKNKHNKVFVKPHKRVKLVVAASPAGHGEQVMLYRDWPRAAKVATLRLNKRGKAHYWVRFSPTTRKFHWQTSYAGGLLPARSARVAVRAAY